MGQSKWPRQPIFMCLFAAVVVCNYLAYGGMSSRNNPSPDKTSVRQKSIPRHLSYASNMSVTDYLFSVLPRHTNTCAALYEADDKKFYSAAFLRQREEFDNKVVELTGGMMEGHSGQIEQQGKLYYHLANLPFVNRICEIGFNAGHSAFTWLASNPHVKLVSFDLAEHDYTKPMAKYIRQTFKGRFEIRYGHSVITVTTARQELKQACDILVVDGGHMYQTAKVDLLYMKALARRELNLVILDDYPAQVNEDSIGRAWREVQDEGELLKLLECPLDKDGSTRGVSIGTYTF